MATKVTNGPERHDERDVRSVAFESALRRVRPLNRHIERSQQHLVAKIEYFFVSCNRDKGKRVEVEAHAGKQRAHASMTAAMKKRR